MQRRATVFAPIDFKDRFPALDGIRALAIVMVFLEHYGGGSHGGTVLQLINVVRGYGWMGVDLFFVLSGFLITGILFDTREDSHYFKRFYMRRSLRIFPIFYLVALILLLLTPILHYQWKPGHLLFLIYQGNWLGNYNFDYYTISSATHPWLDANIGHFWSLCVEEQFYLVWPLVVWMVRDRIKLMRLATWICVAALGLRWLMVLLAGNRVGETWIIRTLPFRMDTLLMGAILALLLRGPNAQRWQRRCLPLFLGAGAAAAAVLRLWPEYDSTGRLTIGLTLVGLACTGLIGMALRSSSSTFQLFYWKPLRVLGRYSYGFYLYHVLFRKLEIAGLLFLEAHLHHSLALAGAVIVPLTFVVVFVVSMASYELFEVKFLRLKRHFEYDSEMAARKHAFLVK